jgi:hypothetical protein
MRSATHRPVARAHHQVDDAQLRAAGSLGDRPVVVLSSVQQLERMPGWNLGQARLASLSSRSMHLIADGSHLIAWQHPDLVVGSSSVLWRRQWTQGEPHC